MIAVTQTRKIPGGNAVNCVCNEQGPCLFHSQEGLYVRRAWWGWIPRAKDAIRWALWRYDNPTWREVLAEKAVTQHPNERSE